MDNSEKKTRIEDLTKMLKRAMFEADTNTHRIATELKISPQALSQKLKRGVLPYIEVAQLIEHMGYSLELVKKQ